MTNKHSSSDIFRAASAEAGSSSARLFLNKMLFHWPLYFIFFVICFGIALFYLRYTQPVYEVVAKVLIKDYWSSQNAPLQQLNLEDPQTEKDMQAEIGLMSSIPVVEQIVTDLQLWVTYQQPTRYFSYKDIYSTTPVQFKLIKPGRNFLSDKLDIIIENADYFLLKKPDDTTTERFAFKDNYASSFGTWKLDTTHNLKDYIGKTIRIILNNPKDVVKQYENSITETPIQKSLDLDISLDDEVPERGRAVLNDLLRVYMDASVEEKRQSAQNTLKFVDQRLVSITQELNNVESQYQGYKSNRGITEIIDQSNQYFGNQQSNQKEINDINIKLSVIEGIERYVNSNEGADNPPATLGLDDAGLLGLVKQLTDLQLQRTKLLATLPENNPLFNPINQQITSVKISLRENLKGIKAALLTTRSQLQSMGSGYQSSIRSMPDEERGLNDIKRMQGIKENLYTYLLQKKEELSLDYASTISNALIIDQPHTTVLISPIHKAIYAIAFLFGFLIPTGILYGRDVIKNRVLTKSEIVASTGMSVLSEIIYEENQKPIVVSQNTYISEQFRDLRTKLNYLHPTSQQGRVTLFTSSIAEEGKSFVLCNLGAVLSFAGKKTILLELDLRRPTFSKKLKLDKVNPGLTDFLIGNATKSQIIQPLPVSENLFVITSGNIPPNPSELLESDELKQLIKELRLEYNHILIDSPPVHLLTDAMIVAPLCDVSLYLIRQDFTPKQELEFISELRQEQKLPRMNLVFNGIKIDEYISGYNYSKNSYIKKTPARFKNRVKKFFSRF
ncbi:MAG TPA: polysaccharide biosynthesis tyrosine autokinase [Mucilaginibacter sp.]|jgi:capsular exopolysaccharide synthesis family protein